MSFQSLPTELIQDIYSRLDQRDVAALRRCSRVFGKIGIAYLAKETSIAVTRDSLARIDPAKMNALNLSRDLRQNVQAIKICPFVCWPNHSELQKILSESEKRRAAALYRDQRQFIQSGRYTASLLAFLPGFPNLQEISIYDYPRSAVLQQSGEKGVETSSGDLKNILQGEAARETYLLLPKLLNAALSTIGLLRQQRQNSTGQKDGHRYSLRFDYFPWGFVESAFANNQRGIESLTELHLMSDLRMADNSSEERRLFYIKKKTVSRLFATAVNLEVLSLELTAQGPLNETIGKMHWPHLRKLDLYQSEVQREFMLRFLGRHRATLKSLSFTANMLVKEGTYGNASWVRFLERVQKESQLDLEFLGLNSIFRASENQRLGDQWPITYPDIVPPERAARYLMCKKKTNMKEEHDAISQHAYDWKSITWDSIESDLKLLKERTKLNGDSSDDSDEDFPGEYLSDEDLSDEDLSDEDSSDF